MSKKKNTRKFLKIKPKPRVHKDLSGLEVSIDTFGEIRSNTKIEKIIEFLNKNVDDKKLIEHDEQEDLKKKGKAKKKN